MELKRVDKWAKNKAEDKPPKPVPKLVPKPVGKAVVRKIPMGRGGEGRREGSQPSYEQATKRPVPPRSPAFNPELLTELRFKGGLVINTQNCPRAIPARRHWTDDGKCTCEPGTPGRKWVR